MLVECFTWLPEWGFAPDGGGLYMGYIAFDG